MTEVDLQVVAFKSHLQAKVLPAGTVCLVSERGLTTLSGSAIGMLAPLLDGTRTVAQVKREMSQYLPAADVGKILTQLAEANLIGLRPVTVPSRDTDADAYWSLAGLDPASADGAAVEVIALDGTDATAAVAACRASGLAVHDQGEGTAALSLVLCQDYRSPELGPVNQAHLDSGRCWLLVRPDGARLWIGPVFSPGRGPCWACLAKRLEGSQPGESYLRRLPGTVGVTRRTAASLPASRAIGLQMAVLEAAKWLAGHRHEGQQAVFIYDTMTMGGQHHAVARRPQCRACGDPGMVAARVGRPVTGGLRASAGGGPRAERPERVLEAYGHLVDPVTGVVGELRPDPHGPGLVHCYQSGRNRAMAETSLGALRVGLRSRSGGKGVTEAEAKVGALCEALERYCATRDGDEPTVTGSFRALGERAIHPGACQLFDERQFAGRADWNQACAPPHRVPEPFDEGAVTDWTPVWSLLSGEQRLLPTALLYFDPRPTCQPSAVRADSNGNAAGSSLQEAIVHGFLELVERDAVALWWYNRTRQPAVALDSFDDPWIGTLAESCGRLNRQLWVLDVTSDLGIPAMVAISRRTDKQAEDITFGLGAHVDPHIALRHALAELGQLTPAAAGARADGTGYGPADPHLMSWWTRATTANQPYLVPDHGQAARAAADYGHRPGRHLDLARVTAMAAQAGLDILVLDQTRPDVNLPVVKVVVPGLRHFWPRFAPGRLFDVPVRLGRLAAPTGYQELNPTPLYV